MMMKTMLKRANRAKAMDGNHCRWYLRIFQQARNMGLKLNENHNWRGISIM